jgi:hypothetical protein
MTDTLWWMMGVPALGGGLGPFFFLDDGPEPWLESDRRVHNRTG